MIEASAMLDTDEVNRLLDSDPEAAAAQLLQAARTDRADAQTWLGQLYLDGRGLPTHPGEALYWFQRAAHNGVPMAMNMLGRCYENGWGTAVDYTLAAVWYRRAAEQNLDWGIYNVAQMLANGRGMPQDRAEAFRWFQRAASLGHARAMHFLGQYYEYGWVVEANRAAAIDLYRRSAEGGDYRGLCSWASVLTERGQLTAACACLRRAIPLAPRHYLGPLAEQLAQSKHAVLRALADEVRELVQQASATYPCTNAASSL